MSEIPKALSFSGITCHLPIPNGGQKQAHLARFAKLTFQHFFQFQQFGMF